MVIKKFNVFSNLEYEENVEENSCAMNKNKCREIYPEIYY